MLFPSCVTTTCGPLLKVPGNDASHAAVLQHRSPPRSLPCFEFRIRVILGPGHSTSPSTVPYAPRPEVIQVLSLHGKRPARRAVSRIDMGRVVFGASFKQKRKRLRNIYSSKRE